jgi:phosphatidylglycerophosphate synthase
MPSELSVQIRDDVASELPEPATVAAPSSPLERHVIEWLCQPLLGYIPRSVHPNTISLITHFVAWITAGFAVVSTQLPPLPRALCLVAAGLGMLLSMIGDSLDGMHARKTDQCSKLGEMMDHWLDALIVPLVTAGITIALEMPPWALVLVNVTAAMVYHGQLVLYHHKGQFIHPDTTTGMEAQLGLSIGYIALGPLYYYVGRDHVWFDLAVAAVAVLGLYIQMRCNFFYYVRLGRLIRYHLLFVAMGFGWGVLYLMGAIDVYAFLLALVFTSFRISGTYVLFTLTRRAYGGNDWGVLLFIAATFAAHSIGAQLGGSPVAGALPYFACLYMLTRNLLDFSSHFRELRPTAQ